MRHATQGQPRQPRKTAFRDSHASQVVSGMRKKPRSICYRTDLSAAVGRMSAVIPPYQSFGFGLAWLRPSGRSAAEPGGRCGEAPPSNPPLGRLDPVLLGGQKAVALAWSRRSRCGSLWRSWTPWTPRLLTEQSRNTCKSGVRNERRKSSGCPCHIHSPWIELKTTLCDSWIWGTFCPFRVLNKEHV